MTEASRTNVEPRTPGPGKAGVLPEGTRLMEYEIRRVLGKPGGFGVTYLALDTNLDHEVAIKEYLPVEFALRMVDGSITTRSEEDAAAFDWGRRCFLNEARLLARFNHPSVVQVHRLFEANGTAYIVMDYVRGHSLAEELRGTMVADQKRIEALLLPLLEGLESVHAAGVLHRDLKPENILIGEDGTPVLIDFGAARGELGSHSRSMLNVLTAGYAPIEQYSQNGNQGPWSDIYALGAVVYRALTGRKPADAVDRLGEDPVPPLERVIGEGFDANFLRAVDWALRVPIPQRPQTIAEWRRALTGEALAAPKPAVAVNPTPAPLDFDVSFDRTAALADPDDERTQPLRPVVAIAPPAPRPAWHWWLGGAAAALLLALAVSRLAPEPEPVAATAPVAVVQPPPAETAPPERELPVVVIEPELENAPTVEIPPPASAPAPEPVVAAKPAEPKPAPAPTAAQHPPPLPELTDMLPQLNGLRLQAGVPMLRWSRANVLEAQRWADTLAAEDCKPRFNPDPARKPQFRDSLFHAYANGPYEGWRRTPAQVVSRWSEGARYYDRGRCTQAGGGCSQYAQLIAPDMQKVGCGRARCDRAEIWVCTYSPLPQSD